MADIVRSGSNRAAGLCGILSPQMSPAQIHLLHRFQPAVWGKKKKKKEKEKYRRFIMPPYPNRKARA